MDFKDCAVNSTFQNITTQAEEEWFNSNRAEHWMHCDDFVEDGKLMTVKKVFEVVDGNVSPTRIYFSQERSSLPPQQPISAMTEQQTV